MRPASPGTAHAHRRGAGLGALALAAALAAGAGAAEPPAAGGEGFHTPPSRWSGPRSFHTPFLPRYAQRLYLERQAGGASGVAMSPNGAYRLGGDPAAGWRVVDSGELVYEGEATDLSLLVYTERDELLAIRVRDRYPNFRLSARWISEKLVQLRVWWGRVLGTDAIVDVEREQFVYREMVHDGAVPFRQWQQTPPGGP